MMSNEVELDPQQKKKDERKIQPAGGRQQKESDQEANGQAEKEEERVVTMRYDRMTQGNPPYKKKEGRDQGPMQHLTFFLSTFLRLGFEIFSLKLHILYPGGRSG
jgi:hypothetical protein